MNSADVEITHHAVMRFCARYYGTPPENATEVIRGMLADATPEDIGTVGRTLRLISNAFEPAKYYMVEGWRFVLNDDETRLLTCERRIHKGSSRTKKKRK